MDELMNNVREWLPSQEACSASRIQRKFHVGYPRAAHIIDTLQAEARLSEDWDVSIGGYVVLGRQSNTGLQSDGAGRAPEFHQKNICGCYSCVKWREQYRPAAKA